MGLVSILTISSAQSSADELKIMVQKFDQAEQIVCGKQITDDQMAEISSKCKGREKVSKFILIDICQSNLIE